MTMHPVLWQAPQPLWARFGSRETAATAPDQARPAILRFATDEFMEQMLGTLASDPSRLGTLIARPETWRSPAQEQADLVARTPLPRMAQSAVRRAFARSAKPTVGATVDEADVKEQNQTLRRPLKLYQPAHHRYYLVTASLVCAVPGLPERAVVAGDEGQINFVLRRRLPITPGSTDAADEREFAYVKTGQGARWQRLDEGDDADRYVAGEELFPTFALTFQDDSERARTLWTGLVPVGRREEFMGTKVDRTVAPPFADAQRAAVGAPIAPSPQSPQARLTQFQLQVAEPWRALIRASYTQAKALENTGFEDDKAVAKRPTQVFDFNLQQQNTSWLILLDFADYLDAHLKDVWAAIADSGASAGQLTGARKDLYNWLGTATMSTSLQRALRTLAAATVPIPYPHFQSGSGVLGQFRPPASSLRDALRAIRLEGVREKLERSEQIYTSVTAQAPGNALEWPPFHFVLAGVNTSYAADGPFMALSTLGDSDGGAKPDPFTGTAALLTSAPIDKLSALIGRALGPIPATDPPPLPFALQLRDALNGGAGDAGWFVVRFVYTRRDCGPLHPPTISAPTQRFQLANFFDPDAPARPIRITLPLDTSPAGLRKANKNTAFVVSDMLCAQIQRVRGLGLIDLVRSVLPWPLHKDIDLGEGGSCTTGWICSLSIPIVTICALILLIIIVTLLDMVFRWLPFFVFCFPLPGLKGKRATT
jgi:hypothetical protein